MKMLTLLLCLVMLFSCNTTYKHDCWESARGDSLSLNRSVHDTVYLDNRDYDWQQNFGLTHDTDKDSISGKPVKYYLEDKDCSGLAIDFYYGFLRPSDNGTTSELLKLAITDNKKLRPFYRWCLDKTITISDGALGELMGVPARHYAEKFPIPQAK